MKKIIKNNLFGFILGALLFSFIGAYAAIKLSSSEISYKDTTVEQTLNSLYISRTNNDYSTDEKVIGKWVDGKPIYQKTWVNIDVTDMNDGTNHNIIDISNLNAETTVDIRAVGYQLTDGQKYDYSNTFSNSETNPRWFNVWRRQNNYIGINIGNLSITSVTVTLQYTKTTD